MCQPLLQQNNNFIFLVEQAGLLYFFPPPKKLLSMSPMASAGSLAAPAAFVSPFFPTSSSDTSLSAASKTWHVFVGEKEDRGESVVTRWHHASVGGRLAGDRVAAVWPNREAKATTQGQRENMQTKKASISRLVEPATRACFERGAAKNF